jgi:(E)-4-hydroxy-3-methylbut-2-enyl-diphosphate synthase
MGMVESAMEFLRIARDESFHNIVLSMKASNPQVMVQAYRLLIQQMDAEFGEAYPLHLGVTEAGDGEDGRVKSAAGIGTLLEDGIGDTVRVSLTEDPEFEIPVCRDLVKRYISISKTPANNAIPPIEIPNYDPFHFTRRESFAVNNIGGKQVPVVVADMSKMESINSSDLAAIGYHYNASIDKWNIADTAADYIFTGHQILNFNLPGTLKVICYPAVAAGTKNPEKYFPIFDAAGFLESENKNSEMNFVMVDCYSDITPINDYTYLDEIANKKNVVLCLSSSNKQAMPAVRRMFMELKNRSIKNPVILITDSNWNTADEHLIHFSTETGALFLDGFGDGICIGLSSTAYHTSSINNASGRNYLNNLSVEQFCNSTAFSILQATRTRISKTEYISCPSCGRTLFDLQETTARIRSVTYHLKGVKIAIMGCIVNGPGEMADADFGYVGSGPGKITLYKSKEIMKKNIDSSIAVNELVQLLKDSGAWIDPA